MYSLILTKTMSLKFNFLLKKYFLQKAQSNVIGKQCDQIGRFIGLWGAF